MITYTVKRLIHCFFTVLIIVSIVFLLIRLLPTDYYFTEDELIKLSEEQKNDKLYAAGLLEPPLVQLGKYLQNLTRFDLGTSRRIQNSVPVVDVIAGKFMISMRLGMIALVLSLVAGVVMGVLQAAFKDGVIDSLGMALTVFINAVPSIITFSLILIFGSRFLGLPSMYSTRNVGESSILPIICLALPSIASYALWTRRYMVDEITKDYIKLARIKGLSSNTIMFRHVLKNAFVPLTQYLPVSFLYTIGGSLLVERFFSVPGMGTLLVDAIGRYDTNIVQAAIMLYATLGVVGLFLGDILMAMFDPRIRLVARGGVR